MECLQITEKLFMSTKKSFRICDLQQIFLFLILLKIQFFDDITFTAYGIRMKSGTHIMKEKFSARCIYAEQKIIFHSILFHLFMTFAYGEIVCHIFHSFL